MGHLGRRKGKRGFRFSLLALFGLLFICGVISFHLKNMYDQRLPRPVVSPTEYPSELREFLEAAEESEVEVEVLKVHCLSDGWTEEYYWQTKASPELCEFNVSRWRLTPLKKESLEVKYFWERMPDAWNVSPPVEADYFESTVNVVIVMHDRSAQRFYYWWIWDF